MSPPSSSKINLTCPLSTNIAKRDNRVPKPMTDKSIFNPVLDANSPDESPIKKINLFALPRIYVGANTCEKSLINHISGFYNFLYKFFLKN